MEISLHYRVSLSLPLPPLFSWCHYSHNTLPLLVETLHYTTLHDITGLTLTRYHLQCSNMSSKKSHSTGRVFIELDPSTLQERAPISGHKIPRDPIQRIKAEDKRHTTIPREPVTRPLPAEPATPQLRITTPPEAPGQANKLPSSSDKPKRRYPRRSRNDAGSARNGRGSNGITKKGWDLIWDRMLCIECYKEGRQVRGIAKEHSLHVEVEEPANNRLPPPSRSLSTQGRLKSWVKDEGPTLGHLKSWEKDEGPIQTIEVGYIGILR